MGLQQALFYAMVDDGTSEIYRYSGLISRQRLLELSEGEAVEVEKECYSVFQSYAAVINGSP